MSKERPSGKDGKHYYFKPEGSPIEGDGTVKLAAGWYQVITVKQSGSGLPEGKQCIGAVFHAPADAFTPAEGDALQKLELEEIQWATDGDVNASRGTVEDTVQGDKQAHFEDEGYPSSTFSLSGYNRINDALQKELKARAGSVSVDDGAGSLTVTDPKGGELVFGTCYRPSNVSGEVEEWTITSGLLTSLTLNKPLKGNQDFSIQLQVNHRDTYIRTIE